MISQEVREEIHNITKLFQEDCNLTVGRILSETPLVSIQDANNVWLFNRLAQFEYRLQQIEKYLADEIQPEF